MKVGHAQYKIINLFERFCIWLCGTVAAPKYLRYNCDLPTTETAVQIGTGEADCLKQEDMEPLKLPVVVRLYVCCLLYTSRCV